MPITHKPIVDTARARPSDTAYVDVRSTAEFKAGHVPGAVNVPLLDHDEDTGQLMPNPDFVRVMKANFPVDAPLLIGCQSGGRSAKASQMLETFGFTNLTNLTGGFAAWQAAGQAVENSVSAAQDYETLLARAGF